MSALSHPLTAADDTLWLGAAPVSGGRGIALTPDHIALHDLDEDTRIIPWSDVRDLLVTVEVSRWRRPAVATWTFGLFASAIDIISMNVPDDISLDIDTTDGPIEHLANAHNRGGYPRDKVAALHSFVQLLVNDKNIRTALADPEAVVEALDRASRAVVAGEPATPVLRSLVA